MFPSFGGVAEGRGGLRYGCAVELLVEVGCHHNAVIGGDAEEGEESNPDRDAQVDSVNVKESAQSGEGEEPRLAIEPK